MVRMVNKEKWNAFTNQMLHLMMKAEQCADVTLVCDDVQQVKTHSILKSYNLVFRDIFHLLAQMFDETVPKREETSFPYFGVKLSCVCLRIAYRKNCLKLPKGDLMLP